MCLGATGLTSRKAIAYKARYGVTHSFTNYPYGYFFLFCKLVNMSLNCNKFKFK